MTTPPQPAQSETPLLTTQEERDEWRKLRGEGMISAVGEYTPDGFWDVLDDLETLAAKLADMTLAHKNEFYLHERQRQRAEQAEAALSEIQETFDLLASDAAALKAAQRKLNLAWHAVSSADKLNIEEIIIEDAARAQQGREG